MPLRVGDRKLISIGRIGGRAPVKLRLPGFRQSTRRIFQRPSSPTVIDGIQGGHQAFRPRLILLVEQIWLDLANRRWPVFWVSGHFERVRTAGRFPE